MPLLDAYALYIEKTRKLILNLSEAALMPSVNGEL